MPFYCWNCEPCSQYDKTFEVHMTPIAPHCRVCDSAMERDYTTEHSRHVPASGYPYITKNISGEPIEVTSLGHERELCKQYGVEKRDDQAWLSKEHVGQDWKTGKPIYREESGLGMPGCWV